ncbi:unnamed protein product [Auanema sp. JU1783]|nr:unnamed protein product [Auanema sp. JU1783]
MSLRYVEDLALLSQNKPTGLEGVESLLRFSKDATPEVINILKNECDIILECRYCKNLFRSVPNFLTHKRTYCRGLHQAAVAHAQNLRKALEDEADKIEKEQSKKNDKSTGNLKRTNIIGALNKRACDVEVKVPGVDSQLILHTLPRISKEVPITIFENGVQKVVEMPLNMPQKEIIPEDKIVVVMPQDHSSKYREMQLRNRRDPQSKQETTREFSSAEIAILEKCQNYYPQWPDAAGLRCSHPDCTNVRSFGSIQTLVYHIAVKHGSRCTSDDRYPCLICKFTLKTWNGYVTHLFKIHKTIREEHEQFRNKESSEVDKKKIRKNVLRNRSMSPPPNPDEGKMETKDEDTEDSCPPVIHPVSSSLTEEPTNDTDDEPPQLTRMARTRREIKVPKKFRSISPLAASRGTPNKSPSSRPPSVLSYERSASPCSSDGNNNSEMDNSVEKTMMDIPVMSNEITSASLTGNRSPDSSEGSSTSRIDEEIETIPDETCDGLGRDEEMTELQTLSTECGDLQDEMMDTIIKMEEPNVDNDDEGFCTSENVSQLGQSSNQTPQDFTNSETSPTGHDGTMRRGSSVKSEDCDVKVETSESPVANQTSYKFKSGSECSRGKAMSSTPESYAGSAEKLKRPESEASMRTALSDLSTSEKQNIDDSDSDTVFNFNEKKRRGRKSKNDRSREEDDRESPIVRPSRNRRRPEWMDIFVVEDESEKRSNSRKRKDESSKTPEIPPDDLKIKLKVPDFLKRKNEAPLMESALSEDKMKISIRVASPLRKKPHNMKESSSPINGESSSSQAELYANLTHQNYLTPKRRSIDRESMNSTEAVSSPGSRRKQCLAAMGSDPDDVIRIISDNGRAQTPTGDLSSVPVFLSQAQKELFFNALRPRGNPDRQVNASSRSSDAAGPYECEHCGHQVPNLKEGRRHMVGHIRVMRLKCTLCGAGSFFCTDMRSHLMDRCCPMLSRAPPYMLLPGVPCMIRENADKLTEVVDKAHPGRVMYTSGKIISQTNRVPYYPDPKIEEAILGRYVPSPVSSPGKPEANAFED